MSFRLLICSMLCCFVAAVCLGSSSAVASGFVQWTRPTTTSPTTATNTFASVAGINVINYLSLEPADGPIATVLPSKFNDRTHFAVNKERSSSQESARAGRLHVPTTDVVSASTGELLLRVRQETFYDTNVIILPSETPEGLFTCQPLYQHEGEGSLRTQPSWCGVLQFCKRSGSGGMQIVLPNATVIPLLPRDGGVGMGEATVALPWRCSEELPCVVRTQELRASQLGGCYRKANSSAAHRDASDLGPLPQSPVKSTHVTLLWNETLFVFRPLVVSAAWTAAEGLGHIRSVPRPSWGENAPGSIVAPLTRIDHFLQYVTVAYPLGADGRDAQYGPFYKQWAVCALAILHVNGTVVLYDSDRDELLNAPPPTGLKYFTTLQLPTAVPACVPGIETALKLMPSLGDVRKEQVHAPLYSSTFVITCASTGEGFMFDFIIREPGAYPANVSFIGKLVAPAPAATLTPLVPLRTDTTFVLVQPLVTVVNNATGEQNEYFSAYFAYTVGISISRIEHNTIYIRPDGGNQSAAPPPFVTLMFTSDVSTRLNVCPWMTRELVGYSSLISFRTPFRNAELQNITGGIGWVSTAAIPADMVVDVGHGGGNALDAAALEATARVARWVASDGLAYSLITEDLHLLVNGTSGAMVESSDFSIDAHGNAHGGVKFSSPVRTYAYKNATSLSPILAWDRSPPTATGINRTTSALSSTFVLVTHPKSPYPARRGASDVPHMEDGNSVKEPRRLVCSFTLNSHGGITTSHLILTFTPADVRLSSPEEEVEDWGGGRAGRISWVPIDGLAALYNPFTESYCTEAHANSTHLQVLVVPSVTFLVMVQQDVLLVREGSSSKAVEEGHSRVLSNPLRNAIASTASYSYKISLDPSDVTDNIVALNPVGSHMTYVCAYDTLTAYHAVVGNVTWSFKLDSISWCARLKQKCLCPSDNAHLTISTNRNFLIVYIRATFGNATAMGILALHAISGELIGSLAPTFVVGTDECTRSPPLMSSSSPIVELPLPKNARSPHFGANMEWAGVATLLNSRCFVVVFVVTPSAGTRSSESAQMVTTKKSADIEASLGAPKIRDVTKRASAIYSLDVSVMFLRGTWAEFGDKIVIEGDLIFISEKPVHDGRSHGSSVYCFSGTELMRAISFEDSWNSIGVLPKFAATNVLDSILVNSLWFAVQSLPQREKVDLTVGLYVYSTTVVSNHINFEPVASYPNNLENLAQLLELVSVFLVAWPTTPQVCVSAANLTCFAANAVLDRRRELPAEGPIEHYGLPTTDDLGLMVFTTPGYPCHAALYSANMEYGRPELLWREPTWAGQDSGVDMDIGIHSCSDAAISGEGILLMCLPKVHHSNYDTAYPRMYMLQSRNGAVALTLGPGARPGTTTFSDSGSLITYVSTLGTAVTLELAGDIKPEPFVIHSEFCFSEDEANYYIEFHSAANTIRALMVPWNAIAPHIVRTATLGSLPEAFPLRARQFHGFNRMRLGNTFVLEGSRKLVDFLAPALPQSIINATTFNFLRDRKTFLTDSAFSIDLAASDSCPRCDTTSQESLTTYSCPSFCGFNIKSGEQNKYEMLGGSNSFKVWTKSHFGPFIDTGRVHTLPFVGNASLHLERTKQEFRTLFQFFECPVGPDYQDTWTALELRYCLAVPELTGRRWTVVEIAPEAAFATVSSFATAGFSFDSFFKHTQMIFAMKVYQVGHVPALTKLISDALSINAFPKELPNGEVLSTVGTVEAAKADDTTTGYLRVYPPSRRDFFELSTASCDVLDQQIPLCRLQFEVFDPRAEASERARSVVWKSLPGNWGSGFVSTGYSFLLESIVRQPSLTPNGAKPLTCFGVNPSCPSFCQPTNDCVSQMVAYLNHYLYTYTMLPRGSSLVAPPALNMACSEKTHSPFRELVGDHRSFGEPKPPEVMMRFYCTKGNEGVVLTTKVKGQQMIVQRFGDRKSLAHALPAGSTTGNFGSFEFTCSDCQFFILYGIISQPVQWIAAGAVKSLVITVVFYFGIEKARKNHRSQTRAKSRSRHLANRRAMLDERLREHDEFGGWSTTPSEAVSRDTTGTDRFRHNNMSLEDSSFCYQLGEESQRRHFYSSQEISGFKNKPLREMSAKERLIEVKLLRKEIARVNDIIVADAAREERSERKRWALARWLPNPITVYSKIVVLMSGVQHPKEQEAMRARVQDSLSTNHVSERQLIDMLMNIIGESPAERSAVERFSHFYQWNMCLNRQVVVREFIDEASLLTTDSVVLALMEKSLQSVHDRLRESYVLFRLAFLDKRPQSFGSPHRLNNRVQIGATTLCGERTKATEPSRDEDPRGKAEVAVVVDTDQNRDVSVVEPSSHRDPPDRRLTDEPFSSSPVGCMRDETEFSARNSRDPFASVQGYPSDTDAKKNKRPLLSAPENPSHISSKYTSTSTMRSSRACQDLESRAHTFLESARKRYLSERCALVGDERSTTVLSETTMSDTTSVQSSATRQMGVFHYVGGSSACSRKDLAEEGRQTNGGDSHTEKLFSASGPIHEDDAVLYDFCLGGGSRQTKAMRCFSSPKAHDTSAPTDQRQAEHAEATRMSKSHRVPFLLSSQTREFSPPPARTISMFKGVDGFAHPLPEIEATAVLPDKQQRSSEVHEAHQRECEWPIRTALRGGGSSVSVNGDASDVADSTAVGANCETHTQKGSDRIVESGHCDLQPDVSAAAKVKKTDEGGHNWLSERLLGRDTAFGFVDIGDIDAAEWEFYKHTIAARSLKEEVDSFAEMIPTHPQCFEYAALPSRSIDDKLMPSTILIAASILQALGALSIYSVDVLQRSKAREEGSLTSFEIYQCIFFMAFNSSAPSSLLVSVIARADLGALEHFQTVRTKTRGILTDPYLILVLVLFSFPLCTHVLPGLFLYAWMMLPALLVTAGFEYYLRTRLSLHTRVVVGLRFFSRVLILFVVALVFSLSFNYSASYVWSSPEGYLNSGSFRKVSYLEIVANDYNARSFSCFYEHITSTISNFFQMGMLTSIL